MRTCNLDHNFSVLRSSPTDFLIFTLAITTLFYTSSMMLKIKAAITHACLPSLEYSQGFPNDISNGDIVHYILAIPKSVPPPLLCQKRSWSNPRTNPRTSITLLAARSVPPTYGSALDPASWRILRRSSGNPKIVSNAIT